MHQQALSQLAPTNHIYRFYQRRDFLASVARLGYESVDLWTCAAHFLLEPGGCQDTAPLRRELREFGLRLVCLTPEQTCPKPYNMAAKAPALRARTRAYFQNAIRAAHDLACGRVLITSGWQFYSEPREEALRRAEDMVGELCGFARRYGVSLVMETLSPQSTTLVNTIEDMARMERAVCSPSFAVALDLDTILNAGETPEAYFVRFPGRVLQCHFMDHLPGSAGHCAWGDGGSDPAALLACFAAHGYTGPYALEYTLPRYFKEPHLVYEKTRNILAPYFQM